MKNGKEKKMKTYDFTVRDNHGEEVSLAKYAGKILLVVNTATKCGLTPQYAQLEALYKKYHEKGFEILDFPCNQFREQAPGTDEEINSFCSMTYGTTFPRFAKIDVNGEHADPFFVYLKDQVEEENDAGMAALNERLKGLTPFTGKKDIKWNFSKFLINQKGEVVSWFSPTWKPEDLAPAIEKLLN
jgi:glutathione peroxidase